MSWKPYVLLIFSRVRTSDQNSPLFLKSYLTSPLILFKGGINFSPQIIIKIKKRENGNINIPVRLPCHCRSRAPWGIPCWAEGRAATATPATDLHAKSWIINSREQSVLNRDPTNRFPLAVEWWLRIKVSPEKKKLNRKKKLKQSPFSGCNIFPVDRRRRKTYGS